MMKGEWKRSVKHVKQPRNPRRLVVKVGTSTLTRETGSLNLQNMEHLARVLADLEGMGYQPVLVSSGAIGIGTKKLRLGERPTELRMKQAAAAVGQCRMMHIYDKLFAEYNRTVAQILLTGEDVESPVRSEHLHNTFEALLELGVIPVVNENDSVSSAEIETGQCKVLGDNDTLSAIVARLCGAGLLVLFSDIDGLYDADPRTHPDARLIHQVEAITPELRAMAGGAGTWRGTGGMATKVEGAKLASGAGVPVVICRSAEPDVLQKAVAGTARGTYFKAGSGMKTRLQWMAFYAPTKGNIYIDPGAAEALCRRGKSLLPAGVRAAEGDFAPGDFVRVWLSGGGALLGRGIVNYSSQELKNIAGLSSAEAASRCPGRPPEVIHQDNWAYTEQEVTE